MRDIRVNARFRRSGMDRAVVSVAVALVAVVLTGCGSTDPDTAASAASTAPAGLMPASHIHGVGIDPAGGTRLLATHDGLFVVGEDGVSTRIGPAIDLMGFAVAGPGHFLASGHPGPGVDLPQPVGLIESTDGGRTWDPLSRQGESDFHALAVSDTGVIAYDGSLWRSHDGAEWEQVAIPSAPATLAAAPDDMRLLATTQQGLLQSADSGRSWSPVVGAPLLQVVDWSPHGDSVAGVDPTGVLWTSADGGATWQEGPNLGSAPQALDVSGSGAAARILVVTTEALVESQDNGRTFDIVLEH